MRTVRVFAALLAVCLAPAALALTVSSADNQIFSVNTGVQNLLPITIRADRDGEITAASGIRLVITPSDYNFRFLQDFSGAIAFTGSAAGKIGSGSVVPAAMTSIFFPVIADFKAGESVTVSGLKIAVYNRSQPDRNIGVDVTGDGVADASDAAIVRIRDDGSSASRNAQPPSEVRDVTVARSGDVVTLSGALPGDLDLISVRAEALDANGNVLVAANNVVLAGMTLTVPPSAVTIRIRTANSRGIWSLGVTIAIPAPTSTPTGSTATSTGTTVTIPASSGAVYDQGTIVTTPTDTTPSTVYNAQRYVPNFVHYWNLLSPLVVRIDYELRIRVGSATSATAVARAVEARNNAVIDLERLDSAAPADYRTIIFSLRGHLVDMLAALQ